MINRITRMETMLNETRAATDALQEALDRWEKLLPQLDALEKYYTSPQWLADFDADRQGLVPKELSRGVLTEDAVWDLLIDVHELRKRMAALGRAEDTHDASNE